MEKHSELYGPQAQSVLQSLANTLECVLSEAVDDFYDKLIQLEAAKRMLDILSCDERLSLKTQQARNLRFLADPALTEHMHRETALHVGRVHAMVGLDKEDLVRSRSVLIGAIQSRVDMSMHGAAISILGRRLTMDLAYQIESYETLQLARQHALLQITEFAWSAENYTDLIQRCGRVLVELVEVAACAIGRPDAEGTLRFEAAYGQGAEHYLAALSSKEEYRISIHESEPSGRGPTGRSWRSGKPERIRNMQTDPDVERWQRLARDEGIRSSVAIPIRTPGHFPVAILSLYNRLPGGFCGANQRAFVDLLQTLLGFAAARVQAAEGVGRPIPYGQRQRWVSLIRTDALQMHYQPILDLITGSVSKVEVLARLHDMGRVLTPGDFFSVLSTDDFFAIFARGIKQALAQRNRWLNAGFDIGIAINLPSFALGDERYLQATEAALREFACPPQRLTLEVLETERVPAGLEGRDEFGKFKALGILFAEDDLGSGHSSLARLRDLPFDLVKIDRAIVGDAGADATSSLRFVYHLTRLGHSLGKSVIAEGVEDADMLHALRLLGVDLAQGYGIAQPMRGDQLLAWLSGRDRAISPQPHDAPLVQLARRLLWEERAHLNVTQPSCTAGQPAVSEDTASVSTGGTALTDDSGRPM
ncbi:EAL domain-containing protein [Paraburkholderia guartelaensis]|uniref:EAL domain-containing protein n=1 Tax=Paraburkholderia guartelaensis TaxID=2546446 RepID=UPI002AB7DD4A|nr:EAL domain-containing protein [Paraburkholderia guartelaensis]